VARGPQYRNGDQISQGDYGIYIETLETDMLERESASIETAFRYSLRVLQIAFHLYCSPNVKQEQNAICSTCSEYRNITRVEVGNKGEFTIEF